MNRNRKNIFAVGLILLIIVLGIASVFVSSRISGQQSVSPTAPTSKPKAAENEKLIPETGTVTECGSCTAVNKCVANYHCDAVDGKCKRNSGTTVCWSGSTACVATGKVVACVPSSVITCNPDCPTECGKPASTITTCKDSCGNNKTKNCPATVACGTPDLTIVKKAFLDEDSNTPGHYTLNTEIDTVSKDQVFVYAIYIENIGEVKATNVTVSDTLNGQKQELLTFVDAESRCTYTAADRKITCSGLTIEAGDSDTFAFRVKVSGDAANGDVIKNTAKVTYGDVTKEAKKDLAVSTIVGCNHTCTSDEECGGTLVCDTTTNKCRANACLTNSTCICPTPTLAKCNQSCVSDEDCASGLICDTTSSMCRKEACVSKTNCVCATATVTTVPTLAKCNKACNVDSDCAAGLICDSATMMCRKEACVSKTNCVCTVPTALPETGILDVPGVAAFGGGLLLAVVGILLAL